MTSPIPSKSSGINPLLQKLGKTTGLKTGRYEIKELILAAVCVSG
jgi:hypothetical protein